MTHSERSVIIGLHLMGNDLETIYYEMGFDETIITAAEIKKVIENYFPQPIEHENKMYNTLKEFSRENSFCEV